MTLPELKKLHPGYKGQISPDCPVRVLSKYKHAKLSTVILLGRDEFAPCTDQIIADFNARYGPGESTQQRQYGMTIGYYTPSFIRHDITWKADGKIIVLSLMGGKPMGYNLIFTAQDLAQ